MNARVSGLLSGILLAAIAVSPWWYGSTAEPARYGLAAVLLLTVAARRPSSLTIAPSLALVAWYALTALTHLTSSVVLTAEATLLLAASLGVIAFWTEEAAKEGSARALAYVVLAVCAAEALFGIVQDARTPHRIYGMASEIVTSPYGSFVNHNHFAGLMEIGILLSAGLALGHARRAGTIDAPALAHVGLCLGLAAAHLASRSRGGVLALTAGIVALVPLWALARSRRRLSAAFAPAVAVGLLVLLFAWAVVPASARAQLATLLHGPADGSGQYRVAVADATLELWKTHPVAGAGLGTYADAVAAHKKSHGLIQTAHAESDALELASEGGLVGLGLVAWLAWTAAQGFRNRLAQSRDPLRKGLAVGAMAAALSLAAHSLVDFNLRIPSNALVFCAVVGLAAAPRTPPPSNRGREAAFAAILAVCGLAAAWRAAGAVSLDDSLALTSPYERQHALSSTIRWHPYLPEAYRERAHARWRLASSGEDMGVDRLRWAADDVESGIRLRSGWSLLWTDLGWVSFLEGRMDAARAAFDRAVALDTASVPVGIARAELYFRLQRPAEGVEELRRVRGYNPDWPLGTAVAAAKRWTSDEGLLARLVVSPGEAATVGRLAR
jgi:O-antigen ligase